MYERIEQEQQQQQPQQQQEQPMALDTDTAQDTEATESPYPQPITTSEPHDPTTSEPSLPPQGGSGGSHGECCDDCKKTCKRNFWTSVLNAIIKVSTIVLAAFGIQSFGSPTPTLPGEGA